MLRLFLLLPLLFGIIGMWLLFSLSDITPISMCQYSVTYHPSKFEERWGKIWETNVHQWAKSNITNYCSVVKDDINEIEFWLENIDSPFNESIFSKFSYLTTCQNGTTFEYETFIEPLGPAMRHPKSFCYSKKGAFDCIECRNLDKFYFESRDYIVINQKHEETYNVYIDVGASLWDRGSGGSSQNFFYKEYKKKGIKFDRFLCWDPMFPGSKKLLVPADIKSNEAKIPDDLKLQYEFHATFVNTSLEHPENPMTILKAIRERVDMPMFIVFKLDMEISRIELELLKQLEENSWLRDGDVIEFFFEHHACCFFPMIKRWYMGYGNGSDNSNYHDSFQLFSNLRKKGIRAHVWP